MSGSLYLRALSAGGLFAGISLFAAPAAAQCDINWALDASDSWHNPAAWDLGVVPAAGQNVCISRPSGLYVITYSTGAVTIGVFSTNEDFVLTGGELGLNGTGKTNTSFLMTGGQISGAGAFITNGSFEWSGGAFSGTGGLTVINGVTLTGAGTKSLGRDAILNGASTWDDGPLVIDGATLLVNSGASLDIALGASQSVNGGGQTGALTNSGEITKTGANDVTFGGEVAVVNAGTLRILEGALHLVGPSSYTQTAGTTVLNAGATLSAETLIDIQGGALVGEGLAAGDLENAGTISPASGGTGALTVDGDYTQTASGALNIDISSTESDLLDISGVASFAGTINVTLLGGFTPAVGQRFTVATFSSGSGVFATANLPSLSGVCFHVERTANQLEVVATMLGDLDASNSVDLGDLAILLGNFGTLSGADPGDGDLDNDGDIDISDLAIALASFGQSC